MDLVLPSVVIAGLGRTGTAEDKDPGVLEMWQTTATAPVFFVVKCLPRVNTIDVSKQGQDGVTIVTLAQELRASHGAGDGVSMSWCEEQGHLEKRHNARFEPYLPSHEYDPLSQG